MRNRVRFQQFASVRDGGLELVYQARLARARLTNCRNDLPVSSTGLLQRTGHRRHLAFAPDEPRQPAPRRELEVRPERPGAHHLVHLDRGVESLYCRRPQRSELEVALAQSLRRLARRDRTGGAAVCIRAARLVTCPTGVYSVWPPVSIDRTTTSPVFTPTRASTGIFPSARRRSA